MELPNRRSADLEGSAATARVRLAANPATPPALLERLAVDPSATVRAAVALNPAAPGLSHLPLARDPDPRVRDLLARKLGGASGALPRGIAERMADTAWQALCLLVTDETVRVRAALAEIVAGMPDAPRDLILRLAHDTVISVCGPVIQLSPLLTTDDLLTLIAAPPCPAAIEAVARRAVLPEAVTDAVARIGGSDAIAALLSNPGAAIREATLDKLIAQAVGQASWHAPLVRRPKLSARASLALCDIVATEFLRELAARSDLPPDALRALRERILARLSPEAADGGGGDVRSWSQRPVAAAGAAYPFGLQAMQDATATAMALQRRGGLTEDAVREAVRAGNAAYAGTLLAVAADVPYATIQRVARMRSAKAIVALTWRAGFGMRLATELQHAVGQITPDAAIRAAPDGGFPLGEEEMRTYLGFLEGRDSDCRPDGSW